MDWTVPNFDNQARPGIEQAAALWAAAEIDRQQPTGVQSALYVELLESPSTTLWTGNPGEELLLLLHQRGKDIPLVPQQLGAFFGIHLNESHVRLPQCSILRA